MQRPSTQMGVGAHGLLTDILRFIVAALLNLDIDRVAFRSGATKNAESRTGGYPCRFLSHRAALRANTSRAV